jgi:hypothetical protein
MSRNSSWKATPPTPRRANRKPMYMAFGIVGGIAVVAIVAIILMLSVGSSSKHPVDWSLEELAEQMRANGLKFDWKPTKYTEPYCKGMMIYLPDRCRVSVSRNEDWDKLFKEHEGFVLLIVQQNGDDIGNRKQYIVPKAKKDSKRELDWTVRGNNFYLVGYSRDIDHVNEYTP